MSFPEVMNYLLGEGCGVEWDQTAKKKLLTLMIYSH